ncbi:hypothetical protein AAC03nite_20340 [Alicyclobacillus acidoterrestris]|nr:hypothetical protein AAC03nite_20340 [Alicyclobacillus acidoterrestris]
MTRLILPLPPSVNHAYRNFTTKRGERKRVPTANAVRFKRDAGWLAKAWAQRTGWSKTERQKVIMRYWVYWPDGRKRDVDNLLKFLEDSLVGILVDDDRYLLPRAMDYEVDKQNPRLEIEIEIMG